MGQAAIIPAPDVEPLIARVHEYNPQANTALLRAAYELAADAHKEQLRRSGEPYIVHPLQVAMILAEIHSDLPSIMAGLLHDVVEDTTIDLDTIRDRFGDEVAHLVDGVTKLTRTELLRRSLEEAGDPEGEGLPVEKAQERAANIRKVLLAMARDLRVMIIKLADRLHNMQTLENMPEEKQRQTAQETLQIYAPLAHRLGIWHFKWQLEDLSFKYIHRQAHDEIRAQLARTRRERDDDVAEVQRILGERLKEHHIDAEIHGRAKHLYSIWNKIQQQELKLDELYDLIAVRVITNTIAECYQVLGLVHGLWLPIPNLFSDHIARPKPNMYQSLHTKVIGPRGEPIEIQIRTHEMHKTADFGIAAHWQYKEGGKSDRRFEDKLTWLRQQINDWQHDHSSDTEFMSSVIEELFTDQVFVFTPRGDVIDLPVGSGPIDFAFRIHSELGLKCAGAKVNGKMVSLNHVFKSGDIVEIITRGTAKPSYDWLQIVKSAHARNRIKVWFRKQHHAENVAKGRDMLEREARRQGLDPKEALQSESLGDIASLMNYNHVEDLLAGIGHGHVAPISIINKLKAQEQHPAVVISARGTTGALQIKSSDLTGLVAKRARCCKPLPGEDAVGFVTVGRGMSIHRSGCGNILDAIQHQPDRFQPVNWVADPRQKFDVPLRIDTLDKVGVMAEVSQAFRDRNINIEEARIRSKPGESAIWEIVIDVTSREELDHAVRVISSIPEVLAVSRTGGTRNGKATQRAAEA